MSESALRVLWRCLGLPSDALENVFTYGLVFLGTFYALSALDVPGHPRVWEGLTKSLEAEMVFLMQGLVKSIMLLWRLCRLGMVSMAGAVGTWSVGGTRSGTGRWCQKLRDSAGFVCTMKENLVQWDMTKSCYIKGGRCWALLAIEYCFGHGRKQGGWGHGSYICLWSDYRGPVFGSWTVDMSWSY